jgi:hypothetical protein
VSDVAVEIRPRLVTNGELQSFKQCRRRWWLAWIRRLRPVSPKKAGAAALGTRVHEALQAYYQPEPSNPYAVLQAGISRDLELAKDDPVLQAEIAKDGELAMVMLEGYFEYLAQTGDDSDLAIVAVETKVQAPFMDLTQPMPGLEKETRAIVLRYWQRVDVMGKLDLRVMRQVDEARFFVDHKTVGSIAAATKMLGMHEQMLHYHLLEYLDHLAVLGPEDGMHAPRTDGGIYNMLRKVKRTAKATPPFYARAEVHHNVAELRSYYMRVWGEVQDMLRAEMQLRVQGMDPRQVAQPSPQDSCTWKCEFFGVCPIFDDNPEAAEQFLTAWFTEGDPLDRYEVEAKELP